MKEVKSFLTEVSERVALTMDEVSLQLSSMVETPLGITRPSSEQLKGALGSLSAEDLNVLRADFGDEIVEEFIKTIGGT